MTDTTTPGLDADQLAIMQAGSVSVEAVHEYLVHGQTAEPETVAPTAAHFTQLFLKSVTVQGFRGIADETVLELKSQPGLTIIQGANGSGKSSFAEAVEVVLTGTSYRWNERGNSDFKGGFRNLHKPDPTKVSIDLDASGVKVPLTLTRSWEQGAKVDDTTFSASGYGVKADSTLESLGIEQAIGSYRPVLTNEELGRVHDRRKVDAFRQVEAILGLESLNVSAENIRTARLAVNKEVGASTNAKAELLDSLEGSEAASAPRALTLLADGQIDELRSLVDGNTVDGEAVRRMRSVAAFQLTGQDEFDGLVADMREAVERVRDLADSEAGRAAGTERVLSSAIDHHRQHGDSDCPVCGQGRLNGEWLTTAEAELVRLGEVASEYRQAEATARQTRSNIEAIAVIDADDARSLEDWDELPALLDALAHWSTATAQTDDTLAGAAVAAHEQLRPLQDHAIATATERLAALQAEWAPLQRQVASWLELHDRAMVCAGYVSQLKETETKLAAMIAQLRTERFGPIRDRSIEIWKELRHESSVDIDDMNLGTKSLNIDVNVDGKEATALAVMSQGELNCLALSLFIPRATHPDSPFQFVVIDDPIQAMDPSKVDGLAKVLETASQTHQVVVFTHDPRLSAAMSRLAIAADVIEVSRTTESSVTVHPTVGHVVRPFKNAHDVVSSDLDEAVTRKVVAGYCSRGLEAACAEKVIRTRLKAGESHAAAQAAVDNTTSLMHLLALAMFDDAKRSGEVFATLNNWDRKFTDAVNACRKGGHSAVAGDLHGLINDAQSLAERIRL